MIYEYFAAANTSEGFISYFPFIFSPEKFKRLYVIKGGPGTGKSTQMKRIGKAAEKRGLDVYYYYCSSDTSSLDGIVIPALSFGMLDGTSPHMTDPEYPGAADVIYDLYPYFDTEKLTCRRGRIIELSKENKRLHKLSALYHSYAGQSFEESLKLIGKCLKTEKICAAASRIASKRENIEGEPEQRQISAFSTRGKVVLDTYEKYADSMICLRDFHGAAYHFTCAVRRELQNKGIKFYYSINTENPGVCDALFIPGSNTAITVKAPDQNVKTVNMKRFTDPDKFKKIKPALTFCEKITKELYAKAETYIKEAGQAHDLLEAQYKNAVDFNGVEEKTNSLINDLFR